MYICSFDAVLAPHCLASLASTDDNAYLCALERECVWVCVIMYMSACSNKNKRTKCEERQWSLNHKWMNPKIHAYLHRYWQEYTRKCKLLSWTSKKQTQNESLYMHVVYYVCTNDSKLIKSMKVTYRLVLNWLRESIYKYFN